MLRQKLLSSLLSVTLAATTLFYACRKTDSIPASQSSAQCNISGRVVDDSGEPVSGATVRAGSVTIQTNVNGEFNLSGVPLSNDGLAFVRVEKANFFEGSRTVPARKGSTTPVRIQLIPRRFVASFSAASGGTAPLDNGGSVVFQADGFVDAATGSPYSGTVKVAAFTFDPTAANFTDLMPGSLRATRADNSTTLLRSFSMATVELQGASGQKLQLKAGKEATMTFPIPPSIANEAPPSIPLWYFDEQTGVWKEEGSAQKQGTFYVGTVKHFTPWNCDSPQDFLEFSSRLMRPSPANPAANPGFQPARGVRVRFTNLVSQNWMEAFTDMDGYVSAPLPRNVQVRMDVYNECNEVRHTEIVGPYTSSSASTTTTLTNFNPASTATISGTVTSCNGAPLAQGVVNVVIGGQMFRADVVNGSYTYAHYNCGGTVSAYVTAADPGNLIMGPEHAVTLQPGASVVVNLQACGTSMNEYVTYNFNGSIHNMSPFSDSVVLWSYPSETFLYALPRTPSQQYAIGMKMSGPQSTGTRPITEFQLVHNFILYESTQPGTATYTEFGSIGHYVSGTFSATLRDSANLNTYPVTGNFRLRRTF